MATFNGTPTTDEVYCVINSSDSIEDLADEINMRVSGATRSLIDCKDYNKFNKAFSNLHSPESLIEGLSQTPKSELGRATTSDLSK